MFQFTVVNLKPKRIPPALITSIAALSLTRDEQKDLSTRLEKVGVGMREVELMSRIAYDGKSPFAERVNMAVGGPKASETLLGYAGVKRIANEWYRCKRSGLIRLARAIADTNNSSNARSEWKARAYWFEFCATFWKAIRNVVGEELWQKQAGNNLFVASNLWSLQESILATLDRYPHKMWELPTSLSTPERSEKLQAILAQYTTELMNYFPPALWTAAWHSDYKQNATNDKRLKLVKRFDEFIGQGSGSSIGYWKGWDNSPILKGDQ